MRITLEDAAKYWAHPSQRQDGGLPDWAAYYAQDGVCIMLHPMPGVGVFMAHIGVEPRAWGHVTQPCKALLAEAMADLGAERFVTWIDENNRAVVALCRRIGAELDGRLPLASPILMYGWAQKWV